MIGRNEQCPCGSGRKFKKCCLLKRPGAGRRSTGEFQFEPGSYSGPGGYVPSLACYRTSSLGNKEYRFVLVNPSRVVESEDEAARCATADFSEACRIDDATASVEAMARQLAGRGYVVLEGFKIVGDKWLTSLWCVPWQSHARSRRQVRPTALCFHLLSHRRRGLVRSAVVSVITLLRLEPREGERFSLSLACGASRAAAGCIPVPDAALR